MQIQYIDTINVLFCILQQLLKLMATNLNASMTSAYKILPHPDKYPWCVLNNMIYSYYSGNKFYARFNCISWSLDWKGRPYSMACEVTWPESTSLFLWEYVNSLVFETPVETDMELVTRIVAAQDIIKKTKGYVSGCCRILYTDVIFALRLVAVNLSNCCKMSNGTLIVSMYCICR